MGYYSPREWIEREEAEGELKRVKAEVNGDLEIERILL